MRLSRIYSNRVEEFPAIDFRDGLNVVLGQIRDPANLNRDSHNLGKSSLAALIDFCLLRERRKDFFLFKHQDRFNPFTFFIEIRLNTDEFLTLRRSVAKASKISFKRHAKRGQDFYSQPPARWDHEDVPFERSKEILDGLLALHAAKPWSYRHPLGYALRLQADYLDVFQLDKNRGKHKEWKPFLAHLLGFDGTLVEESYAIEDEIENKVAEEKTLSSQLRVAGIDDGPSDKIQGLMLLKAAEVKQLESNLNKYDFEVPDGTINKDLVERIEQQIAASNERRYQLSLAQQRIESSLASDVKFDLGQIEEVFRDAKIYFGEQIRRDYTALLEFVKTISEERAQYLSEESKEIDAELTDLTSKLTVLNQERVKALETLRAAETFEKYRRIAEDLVGRKADLQALVQQKKIVDSLQDLRGRIRALEERRATNKAALEENLSAPRSIYSDIRLRFNALVKSIVDQPAMISTRINKKGHLEFTAEILDEHGAATSKDAGHTYRKLLCIVFDLATVAAYLDAAFLRFVYHDGVFESLDDRKKLQLVTQMRNYAELGIQQIITCIDSDLPIDVDGRRFRFGDDEIVRVLHDEGPQGLLFRMPGW